MPGQGVGPWWPEGRCVPLCHGAPRGREATQLGTPSWPHAQGWGVGVQEGHAFHSQSAHYFADKGPSGQSYGFSSGHVQM